MKLESLTSEEQVEHLIEEYSEDEITEITVHSIQAPIKDGFNTAHDTWIIHIDREEWGFQRQKKEPVKQKARELAEERKPAVVFIENRDGEVSRVEVAE